MENSIAAMPAMRVTHTTPNVRFTSRDRALFREQGYISIYKLENPAAFEEYQENGLHLEYQPHPNTSRIHTNMYG